jgi:hypothetical protein
MHQSISSRRLLLPLRFIIIAAVALVLFPSFFAIAAHAYTPMYVPGTPVTDDMLAIDGATMGTPLSRTCNINGRLNNCIEAFSNDLNLCVNDPEYISRTPYIASQQGHLYLGSLTTQDTYYIMCGQRLTHLSETYEPMKLVFTTNGTLPDINGPYVMNMTQFVYPGDGSPFFIVARCIEPGKLPGRFAYIKFRDLGYSCKTNTELNWRYETHDKNLILPQCDYARGGSKYCDGQTIVDQSLLPPPAGSSSDTHRPQPFLLNVSFLLLLSLLLLVLVDI